MNSILKKFFTVFFAFFVLSFCSCVTNTEEQTQDHASKTELQPEVAPVVENIKQIPKGIEIGNVPPEDKNISMYYYVKYGDNLSKIAKNIYGNVSEWKKLAEINNIKNPNQIYAGDFIRYTLDTTSKSFADKYVNIPKAKIVVKSGDTLGAISKEVYGRVSEWRTLWKENPQIKNPDKLIVGSDIFYRATQNLPNSITQNNKSENKDQFLTKKSTIKIENEDELLPKVIVQKGDTLMSIAKQVYGHDSDWKRLMAENPQIKDPNLLKIGMEIYYNPSEKKSSDQIISNAAL